VLAFTQEELRIRVATLLHLVEPVPGEGNEGGVVELLPMLVVDLDENVIVLVEDAGIAAVVDAEVVIARVRDEDTVDQFTAARVVEGGRATPGQVPVASKAGVVGFQAPALADVGV